MAKVAKKNLQASEKNGYGQLKAIIWGYDFAWLANEAGVCKATLYNWCDGRTKHPRFTTLVKVAKVLGFELVLVKTGKPVLKLVT